MADQKMNNEDKLNAIIAELEQQRNWAMTRCAAMAAEIERLKKEKSEQLQADKPNP